MERNQPIERLNFKQCHTNGCSIDASNICKNGKAIICNTCAAILHYDCDLKIKDEKGFVENSMELLKDLIQRMNPIEFVCAFNMSSRNLREELRHIQELIEKFECKVKRDPIDIANVDDYVDKVRNLLKQVLNSQVYKAYIDYNSRLKISREITRKLEEGDQENELRFISSQFYLKIKEREMESREKLVNSITQEFTQRITQMDDKIKKLEKGEKESDKKINEINNTIEKNAKSTLRNFKELKEKTNESFENVQKNNELSLNKISQKLNEETKQIEEVKENQEKLKVILENSEKNQEKLEKNQGKLEKNQGNFDKKIKQFANKQDLNKNKTDCKKLIEKSSKETEMNILKLKNRVDKFEKKLSDVDEYVNEKGKKEKYKNMINQLKLKEDQYYIDEFKNDDSFVSRFENAKKVYLKLGQHAFPHQFDSSRLLQIEKSTISLYKYIYFGQLAEGTNKGDGVGIKVDSDGAIFEGCWKNGRLNGFGRHIYNYGAYYIGEFKDDKKQGQGTLWRSDSTKYVGEWKDGKYHGKGVEYADDGQISREGVWADNKYVGKG